MRKVIGSIGRKSLPFLVFIGFLLLRLPFYNVYGDADEARQVPEANWLDEGLPMFGVYGPGHPPFWFWTIVTIWRVAGVQDGWTRYCIAKTLTIISVAMISALAYVIAERLYSSRISGIVSCFLVLSSWNFFYYGITASVNCYAVMLVMISTYLLFIERKCAPLLSALFLGLASASRYSIVPVIPLLLVFIGYDAVRRRRLLLIPVSFVLMLLPFLLFLAFYGEPLLGLAVTSYVGHTTGEFTLREIWVAFARTAWTSAPTLFVAVLGTIPLLLAVRDRRKYLILLSSIALTASFFLDRGSIEPHRLLESESMAALVGGAVCKPIFDIRINYRSERVERSRAKVTWLITTILITTLIVGFVGRCYMEVNTKANDLRSSDRNTYLPIVVNLVEAHTSRDDYVISSLPLIPFLANRRAFILNSTTDLVWLCETHEVGAVVVGPYDNFPSGFMTYLAEKYTVKLKAPYWGEVWIK